MLKKLSLAAVGVLVVSSGALGAEARTPGVDGADTAWVLISAALVLLMTPGLAFFYGGLVRKKNVLSILMQCMVAISLVTVQWVAFGYSLAFGPDKGGVIGGLEWAGLAGVGAAPNADYAATVPHQAFMIFQAMFAIITPALVLGAFAERMKFSAYCLFILLWSTLIYDPVAHWVWGTGGFLREWGVLDFAGGAVVHVNAGMAALAAALVFGRRLGYPDRLSPPHNLPFAVLGAGLLWFGWFGFNAGSALSSGTLSTSAFVTTHIAGATAGLVWAILDRTFNKKPTVLGMITGAVAGLAAVTPAAGFVTPLGAMVIGVGAAVIPYFFVSYVKARLGYDDSLDAFGVHGVGGTWGVVATGLFATTAVNLAGADGFFRGNAKLLAVQVAATLIVAAFSFVGSLAVFGIVRVLVGLRVGEHEERLGLDLTQHREAGYTLVD